MTHLAWGFRIAFGTEVPDAERARAASAAEWLAGQVADGSTVLVVTHGVFRRLLAERLLSIGWTSAGRRGGYAPWSAWTFRSG